MRTLIVDDEAPARERLKRLLVGIKGVELVGEAVDGVQAVQMIEALSPDLVLLDIQMPGLDGFGVIEALEDSPSLSRPTTSTPFAPLRSARWTTCSSPLAGRDWKRPYIAPTQLWLRSKSSPPD
jgi:CheY-like chemotaxis protein